MFGIFERLEPSMSHAKSRGGMLVVLGAAAGAFGAAAMMSAAVAPTARADDFTEIISSVDADFTAATEDFNSAYADFGSSELAPGLASFLDGVNDDLLSAPENLLIGTAEALDNEAISPPLTWNLVPEASFADGLAQAESDFSQGEGFLSQAATDLSSGDYGDAVSADLNGLDLVAIAPLDDLLLGSLASL
jgi:hypothetical protein